MTANASGSVSGSSSASASSPSSKHALHIGWGQADITPDQPVYVSGQFDARVSDGVLDPLSVTALAMDTGEDHVVFVTCDLLKLSDEMVSLIQQKTSHLPGLDPQKIVMNATHTHTAPEVRHSMPGSGMAANGSGIELEAMPVEDYIAFMTDRTAGAIAKAWTSRALGKVAYGMTHAVLGRNRRWTTLEGQGVMYGDTSKANFSHIEGYEDASVNILATYDQNDALTGVVLNTACPSQVTEHLYQLSADYWCETRIELRKEFGEKLFILPQCSAAGDQAPRPIWGKAAEERMLKLKGRSQRQELAHRLCNAVKEVLPAIKPTATGDLPLTHRVVKIAVPLNKITQAHVDSAMAEAQTCLAKYENEKAILEADPSLRDKPYWYKQVTTHFRRASWLMEVKSRFEGSKTCSTCDVTLHVLRLGDMALATQPFEYYLDFGIRIKARSPAAQTFLVQLVGTGTYCPSERSVKGGGYGSVPASNAVGPEAGAVICEESLKAINALWA